MHNALWSIAQQLLRQAFVALFMLVLMRHVTPLEFGLIGIANIWNTFLTLFLELGFAAALVQRKEITRSQIASACVLNFGAGAALMLLSMAISGPASALMNAPAAQAVIFTLSLSFLVTALASPQIALAQREFRFKDLAIRDFIAQMLSAGLGIILAVQGFGVWAVVANSILLNVIYAVLVWQMSPHRPDFRQASIETMREIWGYGSKVFASTGLKYFFRSADSILVGMLFGPEKLGLYNFSQRVTAAPTKSIQFGLAAYLFPKASVLQDDPARLRELFLTGYKVLNYLILTFSILLLSVGEGLIAFVFGEQWRSASPMIHILIFIQFLAPAFVPMAELTKAANRPNWLLSWSIVVLALTTASLWIGSFISFHASAWGLVAAWFLTAPLTTWIIRETTNLTLLEFWSRVRKSYFIPACSGLFLFSVVKLSLSFPVLLAIATVILFLQTTVIYCLDPDIRRLARLAFRPFAAPLGAA